jgi:hypothetical protein
MNYAPSALGYHARAIDLPTFRARMAKVAESAVLLRALQPEFPLDEGGPQAWGRERGRLAQRLIGPLGRLVRSPKHLDRHFRAEIAAGYAEGTLRGRSKLPERLTPSPAPHGSGTSKES